MKKEAMAIELKQITKTFGSVVANNKIDLSVKQGEILALLGENGSGKNNIDEHALRYLQARQRFYFH